MIVYWSTLLAAVCIMGVGQYLARLQGDTLPGYALFNSAQNRRVKYSGTGFKVLSGRRMRFSVWRLNPYLFTASCASALICIAVTGFRYGVGQDYFYTYVPYFEHVYSTGDQWRIETGFYLLNKVVASFTSDPLPVFLICALLFFAFTYAGILYFSTDPKLSVFLLLTTGYFFIFMNAMRQLVAVAILFYALRFVKERRLFPFLLLLVLASSFHQTSAVFAVSYLFSYLPLNLWYAGGFLGLVVAFRTFVADRIMGYVSGSDYSYYVGYDANHTEFGLIGIAISMLIFLFALIIPRLSRRRYTASYRVLLFCQFTAVILNLFIGKIDLVLRIQWFFGLPVIVLIPLALSYIPNRRMRFLCVVLLGGLYVAYMAVTIGINNSNTVLPYRSVFSERSYW